MYTARHREIEPPTQGKDITGFSQKNGAVPVVVKIYNGWFGLRSSATDQEQRRDDGALAPSRLGALRPRDGGW